MKGVNKMTEMEFLQAVSEMADKNGDEALKSEATRRIEKKVADREKNRKSATNDELDDAVYCVLTDKGGSMTSADIIKELAAVGITVNPKTQKDIKGSTVSSCCKRLIEKGLVIRTWSGVKTDSYRYTVAK